MVGDRRRGVPVGADDARRERVKSSDWQRKLGRLWEPGEKRVLSQEMVREVEAEGIACLESRCVIVEVT